ncbi:hypothetical protein GUJ93_ZPchr0012g21266 [Zizania palustris]|uniref:Uncharacterized protein n=1 Tax=Zizania palustris TaxID=103762 RepID=A0A8J5WNF1_ZIZPA|nr:hypothetical protein GUJ93_ZPchr0012g21266 [Zizania palustris]
MPFLAAVEADHGLAVLVTQNFRLLGRGGWSGWCGGSRARLSSFGVGGGRCRTIHRTGMVLWRRWRRCEVGPLCHALVLPEGDHPFLFQVDLVLLGLLNNSFIHQLLKVGVISGNELKGQLILQSPEELGLPGRIGTDLLGRVPGQPVELMQVFDDGPAPLLQVPKLLLLLCNDAVGDMSGTEGNRELRPSMDVSLRQGLAQIVPPFCGGTLELVDSESHPLLLSAGHRCRSALLPCRSFLPAVAVAPASLSIAAPSRSPVAGELLPPRSSLLIAPSFCRCTIPSAPPHLADLQPVFLLVAVKRQFLSLDPGKQSVNRKFVAHVHRFICVVGHGSLSSIYAFSSSSSSVRTHLCCLHVSLFLAI